VSLCQGAGILSCWLAPGTTPDARHAHLDALRRGFAPPGSAARVSSRIARNTVDIGQHVGYACARGEGMRAQRQPTFLCWYADTHACLAGGVEVPWSRCGAKSVILGMSRAGRTDKELLLEQVEPG
jgi:hypothetical protein